MAVCGLSSAYGQSEDGGKNYYSNPKIGKKAPKVNVYLDNTVVSQSEDIKIEIVGETGDSTTVDTSKAVFDQEKYYDYEYSARINRFHRGMGWDYYDDYYTNMYWYSADPWLWGTSIYWGPSWGHYGHWGPYWGSGWALTYGWDYHPYGWGWGPHWGCSWYLGNGWSVGWGYDPFWDPYWGCYGYGWYDPWYGGYGYGHGYGRPGMNGFGHGYLGESVARRGMSYPTNRTNNMMPTRRGGVDLNGSNRGMTSPTGRGNMGGQSASTSRTTPVSGSTRYGKPESLTANRQAMSGRQTNGRSSYSMTGESTRTETSGYRTGTSLPTSSSRSMGSGIDRSSSTNSGSSSSRSSYSGSSSSSRSSSYSGSSSSRSYSGSSSSGRSYSGGGSSHSSGGGHSSSGGGSHSSGGGHR